MLPPPSHLFHQQLGPLRILQPLEPAPIAAEQLGPTAVAGPVATARPGHQKEEAPEEDAAQHQQDACRSAGKTSVEIDQNLRWEPWNLRQVAFKKKDAMSSKTLGDPVEI